MKLYEFPKDELFPQLIYFHVPDRRNWIKLKEFLEGSDFEVKECIDEYYYYEVSYNEQKR